MVKVQYIGDGHTSVYLEKNSREKTKVSSGEIIDVSEGLAKKLAYNQFQIVESKISVKVEDDGASDINIEVEGKKKAKK